VLCIGNGTNEQTFLLFPFAFLNDLCVCVYIDQTTLFPLTPLQMETEQENFTKYCIPHNTVFQLAFSFTHTCETSSKDTSNNKEAYLKEVLFWLRNSYDTSPHSTDKTQHKIPDGLIPLGETVAGRVPEYEKFYEEVQTNERKVLCAPNWEGKVDYIIQWSRKSSKGIHILLCVRSVFFVFQSEAMYLMHFSMCRMRCFL
jgi:hypothetical protein